MTTQEIIKQQRPGLGDIFAGRTCRNGRKREARRGVVEELRLGVIAGLGQERPVAAEDRRVDDASEHGKCRIGGSKDRLDEAGGWMRRDELIVAVDFLPDRKPRQHVAQALISDRCGHKLAAVVGHDPGQLRPGAEQPWLSVRGENQRPGLVAGAGEITLIGAVPRQGRQWQREPMRKMPADLGFGNCRVGQAGAC